MKNKLKTKHFVETLDKDAVKLITPAEYGCPFHDFAIRISASWAGKAYESFLPVYRKLYPGTYHYFKWEKKVKFWDEPYNISEIVDSKRPVYFYIANYSPELYKLSLSEFLPGYDPAGISAEILFENPSTNEKIFLLEFSDH
jgi:hypothetical protein